MNSAAKVRAEKERHPERFCPEPRCLWRRLHFGHPNVTPCPKHPRGRLLTPDPIRDQLAANCDAHPESEDYDRAERALQDYDKAKPRANG